MESSNTTPVPNSNTTPVPNSNASMPSLAGGRKVKKSKSAKTVKTSKSVQTSKSAKSSKSAQTSKSSKASSSKSSSRGGAEKKNVKEGGFIADDIKNLAVPFAILLAKQGLTSMFDKKKKEEKKVKTPSKPSSLQRRKTVSGGSASVEVRENFNDIAKQINNFLKKY
jgi:hypothetical protein